MRLVLATLAAALVLALTFGFWAAQRTATIFHFETDLTANVSGRAQVYFDPGTGFSEQNSASWPVTAGKPQRLRFAVPGGDLRALRFDPIDREGTATFSRPRIVTDAGTVVAAVGATRWSPNDQIERYDLGDPATVVARPGVNDPYLTAAFAPALRLELTATQRWWEARSTWLRAAALSWAALLALAGAWIQRARLATLAEAYPQRAIVAVAALASVLATYPVVFAGKSFVSPNIVPLLRQIPPTIPGHHDVTQVDLRTPDPAVMLWQNVPYSAIQHEALFEHGELPLWNRYSSAGVTLLGQGQSMLGDPLHLLAIAAGGAAWAWDAKFVLARMLFAAGLGLTVWTVTRNRRAALLTTLAAPFVGFFNFRFNHPAIFSFAYSPWILLGWAWWIAGRGAPGAAGTEAVASPPTHRPSRRGALAALALAHVAVLGSGTVKEAYALLLVLNAAGLLGWALVPSTAAGGKARDARVLGVLGVAILLLTAPLWLTFFSAWREAATVYERPAVWQAPPWFLVGLFDSLFFVELHAKHWGYLGAANLVFALGGLVALAPLVADRRILTGERRFALALLAGFLAAVALAFGWVPAEWVARVPLLRNIYHIHNTFSVPAVVLACAFGGIGLHWAARLGRWPWAAAGAAVAALLLAAYFRGQPESWRAGEGLGGWARGLAAHRFFALNVLLAAAAAAVLWRYLRAGAAGRTPARWHVAVAAALVVLLYRHGLHVPLGIGDDYLVHPMARGDLTTASTVMSAAHADAGGQPFRLVGTDLNVVNGWNAIYGVEGINGPDAIMNRPYRELAEAAELVPPGDWRIGFGPEALATHAPWLDVTGVRYLATDRPLAPPASKVGDFDLSLYRRESAWPRAFFAGEATTYDSPRQLLDQVRSRRAPFVSWQESDADARAALGPFTTSGAPAAAVPATAYELTANTTTFRVRAPARGLAVLHETWLPGDFEATLNGAAVPYVRVNHAFKAVVVPAAGDHTIVFRYWPRHLTLSLWLSLAGLVLLAALLFTRRAHGPAPE